MQQTLLAEPLPKCKACGGSGMYDYEQDEECEDCAGTGVDLDGIPAEVVVGDLPAHVAHFMDSEIPVDPLQEAISLIKAVEERVLFARFSNDPEDLRFGTGDWKQLRRIRVYLENQRRAA